jgi:parallel beta-helix repeat protein
LVIDNIILNNGASGIRLADNDDFNYIIGNTLQNNTMGVEIQPSSTYNTLFHNNFILNKAFQARILDGSPNKWDDGIEGNYWSDYNGSDTTQPPDGIGDTDLPIWEDTHPIMNPWGGSVTRVFSVESGEDPIIINSNCTISSFSFDQSLRQIGFRITGPSILYFFCNVSVSKTRLNLTSSESWLIQLNSTDISAKSIIIENSHTSIYFTGSLSTYEIQIEVVKVGGDGSFTLYAIGFGVAIAAVSITVIVALKKKKRAEMKQ